MKFYNPFKPHIITYKDKFYVRKFSFFFFDWMYLVKEADFWSVFRSYSTEFSCETDARDAVRMMYQPQCVNSRRSKVIVLGNCSWDKNQ